MSIKKRRGVSLVVVAISLPVFLFMALMAVDIAYMQLARTEHRSATDAAAKAGAEALSRTGDKDEAIAAAIAIAGKNYVGGKSLALTADEMVFGRSSLQEDGSWSFEEDAEPFTSVRIDSHLTGDKSVQLLLGSIASIERFSPRRIATAAYADNEVALVVDRSHSMCFDLSGVDWRYPPAIPTGPADPVIYPPDANDSRWAYLEAAIALFNSTVSAIDTSQQVALVTWGSEITLANYEGNLTGQTFPEAVVDVPLGFNTYTAINSAISARGDNVMLGGTNMTSGINLGTNVLTGENTRPNANKTMILMSDGQWNKGGNPRSAAVDAKREGITIHTVSFLEGADQDDMKMIASVTGGRHYHASDGEELAEVFYELAISLPVVLTD
ncbi:MAG: VWA domain-containing protein [Planctomycetales bacterium]|nr:VWA domain-containing protein [Planctomycetales bacterium]